MLVCLMVAAAALTARADADDAVIPMIAPPQQSVSQSQSVTGHVLSHSKVNLFGTLNGQALGRPWGESYNVYTKEGLWPIQSYYEATYGYYFGSHYSIGVQMAGDQNLSQGVVPAPGYLAIQPALTVYDPVIQFTRFNLIDTSWMSALTTLQASLPVTDYSRDLTRITELTWDMTFSFKLPVQGWFAGINTRVQPTFYRQPQPSVDSWMNRTTFFASTGHFLGYQFSDSFQLKTSSVLDFDHTNDGKSGPWEFGTGNIDRVRLQADYFFLTKTARLGGWVQTPIFQAAVQNTILGVDLSWDILPVRSRD